MIDDKTGMFIALAGAIVSSFLLGSGITSKFMSDKCKEVVECEHKPIRDFIILDLGSGPDTLFIAGTEYMITEDSTVFEYHTFTEK